MRNDSIIDVIDASSRRIFNFRELWQSRELFYFFTWRDIKVKYKQTVLGFLWAILQPLLMMLIFSLVFGRVLNVDTKGLPYPIYVFSGLLMWNIFSSGLSGASASIVTNSSIIKKIYFPRLVIPISSILVALFDFFMAFILYIPILIYYGQPLSLSALWIWPLAVVAAVAATLGLGCWLAALNVKYKDFRYVIPFLIQVLLFTSPVIYPISTVKYPLLQYIMALSPIYGPIELFRMPLTSAPHDTLLMTISISSCMIFLMFGLAYFWKTESSLADLA
jgi:lipopolysaccharide transport system permease protein